MYTPKHLCSAFLVPHKSSVNATQCNTMEDNEVQQIFKDMECNATAVWYNTMKWDTIKYKTMNCKTIDAVHAIQFNNNDKVICNNKTIKQGNNAQEHL